MLLILVLIHATCFAYSSNISDVKLAMSIKTTQHISNEMVGGAPQDDFQVELNDEVADEIIKQAIEYAQKHPMAKRTPLHWSRDKLIGLKDEIKVMARKRGLMTAVVFVAIEIIEFPVIFLAMGAGHPEVYTILSIIRPELSVTFTLELLPKLVHYLKLRSHFEDAANLRLARRHRREILRKFGLKKETDILFDTGNSGLVIKEQGILSKLLTTAFISKALSYKTAKRYLKKKDLWDDTCKAIHGRRDESKETKLLLVLAHFYQRATQEQREDFEERFKKQKVDVRMANINPALFQWARGLLNVDSAEQFRSQFLMYPKRLHPLVIYNVWQYSLLPHVLHHQNKLKFRNYRRMIKLILPLKAHVLELMVTQSEPDQQKFEMVMVDYMSAVFQ